MKPEQFDDFCELLGVVSEQYGKPISAGAKMLYWQGLVDYDFEAVKQGLYRHIRNPDNGMFMPKIADIIKMLQGSTQDSALLAWAKVDKAVRQVGTWQSVVFDDPIIHKVLVDMGGWLSLGSKKEDEWPFVAKEFENRYRGYKQLNTELDYVPVLIGRAEKENFVNGHRNSENPVLIGDKEKAKQVLIAGKNTSNNMIQISDAFKVTA